MKSYEELNSILVKLFNETMAMEERALIKEPFTDISNNDMHIIEAIGDKESKNMSQIAKCLNITVGTLTTAMNSLVKKGYVIRSKSEEDRRMVLIRLSTLGLEAYHRHKKFHEDMVKSAVSGLNETERTVLIKALSSISNYFNKFYCEELD